MLIEIHMVVILFNIFEEAQLNKIYVQRINLYLTNQKDITLNILPI